MWWTMPTNREYLDQLASESPDKLKAWFDAEHVDLKANESEHVQKLDELDSRENLEADIRASLGFTTKDVFAWLDRQAAITEQQIERKWCCYEGSVQSEIDKLQQQVDNLAHDLAESERFREEMREELSIAYDYAHDLLARRDRGLA